MVEEGVPRMEFSPSAKPVIKLRGKWPKSTTSELWNFIDTETKGVFGEGRCYWTLAFVGISVRWQNSCRDNGQQILSGHLQGIQKVKHSFGKFTITKMTAKSNPWWRRESDFQSYQMIQFILSSSHQQKRCKHFKKWLIHRKKRSWPKLSLKKARHLN